MSADLLRVFSAVALVVALVGCGVGPTLDRVALRTLAPGMMAQRDLSMACAAGESLSPVLLAFGHKKAKKEPRKAAALTLISAGICSELAAWDAELDGAQARYVLSRGGDPRQWGAVSSDALVREQRHHQVAAMRNAMAFERTVAVFDAPTQTRDCPDRLKPREELLYLLGLTAGLLAVIHDARAERTLGVSNAIPQHVARGAVCLDDARWWGVPGALRAAVWASVPGAGPQGADPWADLERAAKQGEAQGMWLARALQVQTAASAGKDELVRAAITAHGAALGGASEPAYALLNSYGSAMIQQFSDRLWIGEVGHRTPLGSLGTFPKGAADDGLDSVLEGLPADAAPPAGQVPASAPVNERSQEKPP